MNIGFILSIALGTIEPEVIADGPLSRGTILTDDMIIGETVSKKPFLGMQLRRQIYKGQALRLSDVATPDLVSRQDPVTVLFKRQGLTMTIMGRAMGRGAMGDGVSVLLEGRKKPIRGVIIGDRLVEVQP